MRPSTTATWSRLKRLLFEARPYNFKGVIVVCGIFIVGMIPIRVGASIVAIAD